MIRILWHHGAVVSIRWANVSKLASVTKWRHDALVQAHTFKLQIGRLRIVRFRPSLHHAKRLGLPVF